MLNSRLLSSHVLAGCAALLLHYPVYSMWFFGDLQSSGYFVTSYFPPDLQTDIDIDWPAPVLQMDFYHTWSHQGLDKMTWLIKSDLLWSKLGDEKVSWQHVGLETGLYFGVISTLELGVTAKYLRENPGQFDLSEDLARNIVKGVSIRWDW